MQTASTRTSSPALKQGLIFGLILGVAEVLISLLGRVATLGIITSILSYLLYIGLPLVAGLRASPQTGRVSTGLLAGLWTGLFGSIIASIYTIIAFFLNIDAIRSAAQKASPNVRLTDNLLLIGIVVGVVFIIIVATLIGLGMGAIGGAIGRRRANVPQQQYQETMFQPPPPSQ